MLENILQLHQQNKKVLRADENMLFSEGEERQQMKMSKEEVAKYLAEYLLEIEKSQVPQRQKKVTFFLIF